MKITYNQNPLCTTIELDEYEKKELWYKIKLEELQWMIVGASNRLKKNNVDDAIKKLNLKYVFGKTYSEKSKIDKRTDQLLEIYLQELQSVHMGDCTCFACSCTKCHAEGLIGIDTIKGLTSHEASVINNAFENDSTLNEAIEYLANYDPDAEAEKDPKSWKHQHLETWTKAVPGWKKNASRAYEWLMKYRAEHFPELVPKED